MDALTTTLDNTHLRNTQGEPEQLLFCPEEDSGLPESALDNIPRYLVRVASPRSDGSTDEVWVRSEAAVQNLHSSKEDIFYQLDDRKRETVADTMNYHLRWWPKDGREDNFVSWTSSFLFAIRYIYYRHMCSKDGSSLDDIRLYVIDTTQFPKGTFLCDLDLLNAFYEVDYASGKNLENMKNLRIQTDYYFGEYLSQGSLKIEGKCQMIPARVLFDNNRLNRLQPAFEPLRDEPKSENPGWAKDVVFFRQSVWPLWPHWPASEADDKADCFRAINEITETLAPDWRLPVAIYLAALIGPSRGTTEQKRAYYDALFEFFRDALPAGNQDRLQALDFRVFRRRDIMPELRQVEDIMREIREDWQLRTAIEHAITAEASMNSLQDILDVENENRLSVSGLNEALAQDGETLLLKLRTIRRLCDDIEATIS